jgi:hypothetical protein
VSEPPAPRNPGKTAAVNKLFKKLNILRVPLELSRWFFVVDLLPEISIINSWLRKRKLNTKVAIAM